MCQIKFKKNKKKTDFLLLLCFVKYLPNKTPIFKEKIVPKNVIFGPNIPPDAQCRFLLEVKQMPQWVVSYDVLTTHKVWGKVLFDHFAQSLATFVLNFFSFFLLSKSCPLIGWLIDWQIDSSVGKQSFEGYSIKYASKWFLPLSY